MTCHSDTGMANAKIVQAMTQIKAHVCCTAEQTALARASDTLICFIGHLTSAKAAQCTLHSIVHATHPHDAERLHADAAICRCSMGCCCTAVQGTSSHACCSQDMPCQALQRQAGLVNHGKANTQIRSKCSDHRVSCSQRLAATKQAACTSAVAPLYMLAT